MSGGYRNNTADSDSATLSNHPLWTWVQYVLIEHE